MYYLAVFCVGWVGGMAWVGLRNWWGNREDWRDSPKWGPVRATVYYKHGEVGFCYLRPGGWVHGDIDRATWRSWPRLWRYEQNTDGGL